MTMNKKFKNIQPGDTIYIVSESSDKIGCFEVNEIAYNKTGVKITSEDNSIELFCNGEETTRRMIEYGIDVWYITNKDEAFMMIEKTVRQRILKNIQQINAHINNINSMVDNMREYNKCFSCAIEVDKINDIIIK